MALELRNTSLFGLDLGGLWGRFRSGWAEALRWPVFAWLSPDEPVRVLLPDGSERVVRGTSARPASGSARAVAVVLPDDLVLLRELSLPPLPESELQQAIELDIAASSPFPVDQLAWGWQIDAIDDAAIRCRVALASPAHIDAYLAEQRPRLGETVPELWASEQAPIVFRGYGERPRQKRLRQRRWGIVGMLVLVALLAIGLAATPLLQLRERVFDARARFEQLRAQAGPVVAARDSLVRANERARAIQERSKHSIDLGRLIETVTQLLPDGAYLTRLEVQGRQVKIAGFADNASALMETLGTHREFREVRAPSAITRQGSTGKESFTIEFVIAAADPAAPGAGGASAAQDAASRSAQGEAKGAETKAAETKAAETKAPDAVAVDAKTGGVNASAGPAAAATAAKPAPAASAPAASAQAPAPAPAPASTPAPAASPPAKPQEAPRR
ncbi:MAG: PilN domain-containing protein [Burkholderiaceae bacterium]